jgi:hypothetical protein
MIRKKIISISGRERMENIEAIGKGCFLCSKGAERVRSCAERVRSCSPIGRAVFHSA